MRREAEEYRPGWSERLEAWFWDRLGLIGGLAIWAWLVPDRLAWWQRVLWAIVAIGVADVTLRVLRRWRDRRRARQQ